MEEPDVFDDIPELYSDRLRKCIAVCIAFHSEDRPDAFDLLRVIQRARNDPSTHGAKEKKAEEEEEDDAAKDESSGSLEAAKDKEADDDVRLFGANGRLLKSCYVRGGVCIHVTDLLLFFPGQSRRGRSRCPLRAGRAPYGESRNQDQ
jgi:hypothetical protein